MLPHERLSYYRNWLRHARKRQDSFCEAHCSLELASLLAQQGDFDEAVQMSMRAHELSVELRHPMMATHSAGLLGGIYQARGKFDAAITNYITAIDYARRAENREILAIWLANAAMVLQSLGDGHNALDFADESLEHAEPTGNALVNARAHFAKALVLYSYIGAGKALRDGQEAAHLSRATEDRNTLSNSLVLLGSIFYIRGEIQTAYHHFDEASSVAAHTGDVATLGQALHGKISALRGLGQLKKAMEILAEALKVAKENKLSELEGLIFAELGKIFAQRHQVQKATYSFSLSMAVAIRLRSPHLLGLNLVLKGSLALRSGELGEAEQLFQQALKPLQQIDNQPGIMNCLLELAHVEECRGNDEEAKEHCTDALRHAIDSGSKSGQSVCMVTLGFLKLQRGEPTEAEEWFEQARDLLRDVDFPQVHAIYLRRDGERALLLGDFDTARTRFEDHLDLVRRRGIRCDTPLGTGFLGLTALEEGVPEEAISRLTRAVELCEKAEEAIMALFWGGHLGRALADAGDVAAGMRRIWQALESAQKTQNEQIRPQWLLATGRLHRQGGDLDFARTRLLQALSAARTLQRPYLEAKILEEQARVDLQAKDRTLAKKRLQQCLQIRSEIKDRRLEKTMELLHRLDL